MDFVTPKNNGVLLKLHIQPGATKTEIVGLHGDRLRIRLKAPPVDGKANAGLIRFLSDILKVPKGRITITHGEAGRQKTVFVEAISESGIQDLIKPANFVRWTKANGAIV